MEYTEEEKKAIERCNELKKDCHKEWIGISNQVAIDIVLKLLEKRQKEIENLKKITQTYDSFPKYNMKDNIILASSDYFQNGTFVKKFIPKEAIREKLNKQYELWNTPNRQKEYSQELVDAYEELLGE